ncbi:MAG: CoA transferase [Phenylobacterium sp.]
MSALSAAVRRFGENIADGTAAIGSCVEIGDEVLDARAAWMTLAPPGARSPNGSCRMVRAADGWIAVNLPREDDLASVPAWIGCDLDADPWTAIAGVARTRSVTQQVEDAQRLGLPVAAVGAVRAAHADAPRRRLGVARSDARRRPLRVIDLSSLWAGPLCGALLAQAGCDVRKVESAGRPDVARLSTPGFFAELNGGKSELALDFSDPHDLDHLRREIAAADVLITSARPRAFDQLGLSPEAVFVANPALVWTAVTGYGWEGPLRHRVAFGDDAAAAGGLVRWRQDRPEFMGDALADPLTGLAAAAGTLKALAEGGGVLVDVAMARTAAGVAAEAGLGAAA